MEIQIMGCAGLCHICPCKEEGLEKIMRTTHSLAHSVAALLNENPKIAVVAKKKYRVTVSTVMDALKAIKRVRQS